MRTLGILAAAASLAIAGVAASPASAQYGRGGGWSPGAAAAVGALGGLAVGTAIGAGSRPSYYGPAPAYYGPPPAYYGSGCYVVRRRVWVPGWGWDVRPTEVCE